MSMKRTKRIPPPPLASASDAAKGAYYEKHDPVDLVDAGYFEEEGIFKAEKCLVDLRPERGLIAVPIDARIARRLHRIARQSGRTPSELASRCLDESLHGKPRS